MKNKSCIIYLISLCLISLSFTSLGIKEITWEDLSEVSYRNTFSPRHNTFYMKPIFGKDIQHLNGDEIQITGYVIPVDNMGDIFFLSENPNSSCYFCGAATPHSIMALNLKNLPANYKTDEYLTFKGILNTHDNLEDLPYSLDNAELVKDDED